MTKGLVSATVAGQFCLKSVSRLRLPRGLAAYVQRECLAIAQIDSVCIALARRKSDASTMFTLVVYLRGHLPLSDRRTLELRLLRILAGPDRRPPLILFRRPPGEARDRIYTAAAALFRRRWFQQAAAESVAA